MAEQFMLGGETDEGSGADLIARLDRLYENPEDIPRLNGGIDPEPANPDLDGDDDQSPVDHSSLDEAGGVGPSPTPPEPTEFEIPGNLPDDDPNATSFEIADETPPSDHQIRPVGAEDPAPPTAPPGPAATPTLDLNEYAERVFGDEIGRDQLLNLMEFGAAVSAAPDHVRQQIADLLYNPNSGQFSTSVPVHGDGGGGSPVPPAAAPPGTPPSASPAIGQFDWNDPDLDLDPRVAAHLQQQEALLLQQQEAARQREMQMAAQQMEQYRQQVVAGQEAAFTEFRQAHPNLTETDLSVMLTKIEQTNAFNVAFQVAQDPKAAMTTALNQMLFSDPTLSQKEMAARAAEEEARRRVDQERQRKSGALSGRTSAPAPVGKMTEDEHMRAAAAEIRELLDRS